jgi:hypothetical protein
VTGAKRHHYVPRHYLERFADGDQVFVRRRDGTTFTTNCINVAVESGFYDVELEGGGTSKQVEEILADVEGATAGVFRMIDDTMEAPPHGADEREVLSVYLALQMTRTPEQRERTLFSERLAVYLDGRELTRDRVATYLAEHHLGFAPTDNEVGAAFDLASVALRDRSILTPEFSMRMMLRAVTDVAPRLAQFEWCVEHDRKERLITSDTPLVLWRTPTYRDEFEGFGIETAEEIRFPLDPGKQLVLTRNVRTPSARVNPARSAAANQDAALACHNFLVAHPRERAPVEQLELPARRPTMRFNSGPLLRRLSDGTTVEDGEVLHMWVPRR